MSSAEASTRRSRGARRRRSTTATLGQLLTGSVETSSTAIALTYAGRSLTYFELDEASSRLARELIAAGVGPGDVVAIGIARSLESVLAVWAIAKSGAAYVPVDPSYPADRIAHIVTDSGAVLGVTTAAHHGALRHTGTSWLVLDEPETAARVAARPAHPVSYADRVGTLHEDHPAYVIYTSGSTGKPKGVVVTHAGLAGLAAAEREHYGVTATSRVLHVCSPNFDVSVLELLLAFTAGATLVVAPVTAWGGQELAELLARERVTHMLITPAALESVDPAGLDDLACVVVAGDRFGPELVGRWSVPGMRAMYNGYGPTEATILAASNAAMDPRRAITIGSPIPGVGALILDQGLRPVPDGVTGELYLAGAALAQGYLGRPGLTAERFVANPFAAADAAGSRLYRTGDLVRRVISDDDAPGEIEYLGRSDFQVKIRGFRVELGEIDNALTSHPDVDYAVTLGRTPPGQAGATALVSYVLPTEGAQVDTDKLTAYVAESLPPYMIPAAIVVLEQIPLNSVGKLDRSALPEPVFAARAYRAPSTREEEAAAKVFAEVLGLDEPVGADDDLFEIGGNSLVAARVAARVGAELATRVPIQLVFDTRTVAALAARLADPAVTAGASSGIPLAAMPRSDRVPLSAAQQRMWFLNRFDPTSGAYNIPVAVRLTGVLDVAALAAAVGDVVARHEVLRTSYPEIDGQGSQVVLPPAPITLVAEPATEARLAELIAADVAAGFDVTAAPPVRVRLLDLSAASSELPQHVLVFVVHHISADGWSMGPLTRDVMTAYGARVNGEAPQWEPLSVQYADYTLWQREVLGDEHDPESVGARQLAYWRAQLAGLPEESTFPQDRLRPDVPTLHGGTVAFTIDAATRRGLAELAQARNATMFMVVHAALAVLLARASVAGDVAVGTAIAGRGHAALDDVIGMFVNTLVLRTEVRGGESFADLLTRVREIDSAAFDNADVPFERLVDVLAPERSTVRHALFQVGLQFQNLPTAEFELPGLTVRGIDLAAEVFADVAVERFDLSLAVADSPASADMFAEISYATDLFDADTIHALALRLRTLLAAIAAAPDTAVGDLPVLSQAEDRALSSGRGVAGARTIAPAPATLVDLLAAAVAVHADSPLVSEGDTTLSYRETDAAATRLARLLRSRGVRRADLVALGMPRSLHALIGRFAIVKAGAGFVPIDPKYPADRQLHMLGDSGVRVGLTTAAARPDLPDSIDWLIIDDPALCEGISDAPLTDAERGGAVRPDDVAYVIYTSGSTGLPKGVVVSHGGLAPLNAAFRDRLRGAADARVLVFGSPSFDISIAEILTAIGSGGALVVAPPDLYGGPDLAELVAGAGVTHLLVTPSLLASMDPAGLDTIRLVATGGEALPAELVRRWLDAVPAGTREFVNGYGPTETTVVVNLSDPVVPGKPVTLGGPFAGVSEWILDDRLHPVPVGVPGELYAAGDAVARGYLNRPGLTAERFVACPWAPGQRMYRTGDVVRWVAPADPERADVLDIEYLGRSDFQVKVRGFRVELGEIDAALAAHPTVEFAATFGHRSAAGATLLVSYVVAAAGQSIDVGTLLDHARGGLPAHMIPSSIMVIDHVPVTPVGKLDRDALPEPVFADVAEFRAPRDAVERIIAETMGEILGLARVGIDDSFFALGGDSIVAIQLVSRAKARGVVFTPRQVFEQRTVAGLASVARQADDAAGPVPTELPGGGVGELPLLPVVRFMTERPGGYTRFNQTLVLELPAGIDRADLVATLATVIDHHDALRSSLYRVWRTDEWHWEIGEPGSVDVDALVQRVPLLDAERLDEVAAAAVAAALDELSPADGIVLRFVWLDPADPAQTGRLIVIAHHLVMDGVSWRIIVPDLATAWAQRAAGQPQRLPATGTSLRRWAHALAEDAVSPARTDELPYWQRLLAAPERLLTARPLDPEIDVVGTAAKVEVRVEPMVTSALLRTVPALFHGSVQDGLLTALALALAKRHGGSDARIRLEGHGREEHLLPGADLSRTVGWFTTIYPVGLDLSGIDLADAFAGGPAMGAAVKAVKEQLLAVPDKGIGYGLLRYLNPDTAHQLPQELPGQVSFNYLGQVLDAEPAGHSWLPAAEPGHLPAGYDTDMPVMAAVDINAIVVGDRLTASFGYPTTLLDEAAVRALADDWAAALDALARHSRTAGAGGHTPSDFALVSAAQADVDRWETEFPELADVWPLSELQTGLLFHAQMSTELDVYVAQVILTLSGTLDVARLRDAVHALLTRYPNLRTAFVADDTGKPVQVVLDSVPQRWTETTGDAAVIAAAERRTRFDLAAPPLLRFTLVDTGAQWQLIVTNHHIVLDGWSMPLLLTELLTLYATRADTAALPAPRSYRTFLEWTARQDRSASLSAWRTALAGAEPTLLVPAAADRPVTEISRRHAFGLAETATARLVRVAGEYGVTVNTVVQAAWALLLAKLTGRADVVFGATVSGRPAALAGVESMVGLFINTIAVRVGIDPAETGAALLARTQSEQADLLDHHYLGLAEIQAAAGTHAALFDTLVVFESYPVDAEGIRRQSADIDGLSVTGVDMADATHYPLTLLVNPGARLHIEAGYQPDLLPLDTVAALGDRLLTAITALIDNPAGPVGEIDFLTPAERARVLREWNDTAADIRPEPLPAAFERAVATSPDAIALSFAGATLTYAELHRKANRLAHYLIARGVGAESVVALSLPRSLDLVIAMYAVVAAGAAYLPLDPDQPADRTAHILSTARPVLLLTAQPAAHAAVPVVDVPVVDVPVVDVPVVDVTAADVAGYPETPPAVTISPDSLAYVLFTSGSTGRPKGVAVSHRAIVNRLEWMQREYRLTAADAVLQKTPATFDVSVWEFFWPLRVGARLVVARPDGHRDPAYLAETIAAERVTVAHFVPSLLAAFVDEPRAGQCRSLRDVFASGEALPAATAQRLRALTGARLHNLYGPTEAAVDVTYHEVVAADEVTVPIGRPVANTATYVLDARLRPVPVGMAGELYLAGVQLARGYLGRPDLTADRFVANPYGGAGERLYRTGDLASWTTTGELQYLGRTDFQVKLRGLRIELGEIEAALSAHQSVRHAVAVVRSDDGRTDQLVAYVVGANPDPAELHQALAVRLPGYMVPAAIVVLDALPLHPNGKLDRRALPAPVFTAAAYSAPRTATEQIIAEVVAEVLGLDHVGVDDSFFALGGDSIVAIQLVARVKARGLVLTPRQVFQQRTVAALAAVADRADQAAPALAELPGAGVGPVPLTPAVAYLLDRPGSIGRFNQTLALELPADISDTQLIDVVQAILDAHDALRSRLRDRAWDITPPGSVDAATLVTRVPVVDGARAAAAAAAVDAALGKLSLADGVVVQFVRLDDGAWQRLIVVAHHLVVDGVTWRILVPDFAAAWTRVAAGSPPRLAPASTSLRRWAHGLTDAAVAPERVAELPMWQHIVAAPDPLLGSRAFDPSTDVVSVLRSHAVEVPAAVTKSLLTSVPERFHGAVDAGLLAALVVALETWRARRGPSAGGALIRLEGHGREEQVVPGADLSRTAGWFTAFYPVRFDVAGIDIADALTGGPAMGAMLKTVKEHLNAVPDKGIGYGLLRYLNPDTASALPAALPGQISFNYLGRIGANETAGPWLPATDLGDLPAPADADLAALATLDINAVVVDDRLTASFAYPSTLLPESDVAELAGLWTEALAALAAHAAAPGAGGHTPSDFALVRVTQPDIDAWERRYPSLSDIWPLSDLQAGLAFHAQIAGPDLDVYVAQAVLTLTGAVDRDRLRAAAHALLVRHPNLRSAFVTDATGTPAQIIPAEVDLPWTEHPPTTDATALAAADRVARFDLAGPPLIRFSLVPVTADNGTDAVRLIITSHHILFDGWSMPLLLQELLTLYALRGNAAALPPAASYRSFLEWSAQQDRSASVAVWRDVLSDAEPTLLAPPDAAHRITQLAGHHSIELSEERTAALSAFAVGRGVTVNTVLQVAWGVLVGRLAGRGDVVFGATVSGRPAGLSGVESMVGLFINTIPVRVRFAGGESVGAVVDRVQGEQAGLLEHHFVGLADVQAAVGVGALFDSLLVFESYPVDAEGIRAQAADIDGMSMSALDVVDATHYPLTVAARLGDTLHLDFGYLRDLFSEAEIQTLSARFARVLAAIVAAPDTPAGDLDLLDAAERDRVTVAPNATAREVDPAATLVSLFQAQAARTPDATAVVSDGERLSYAEFATRVNRLARTLIGHGVGPDTLVGLYLRRSIDLLVAVHAVQAAGAAYVPLDPDHPAERTGHILDTARPTLVLSGDDSYLNIATLDTTDLSAAPVTDAERIAPLRPDNSAYVIFTSGSTGRPKGVAVSHRAIVNRLVWMQTAYELTPNDVVLHKTPSTFDVSVWELFWPLQVGATTVVAKPDGHRDPAYLVEMIKAEGVTVAHFVPSMLSAFVAEPGVSGCTSLAQVFASGEALPGASAQALLWNTGARLHNLYGPTEAAVDVTYHEVTAADTVEVPIGRPVFNTGVFVLDDRLHPVGVGVAGELYLSGTQLARGYVGRPDLTADRFVASPFISGARLYRTGDVVAWTQAGELSYRGRADFQVKLRGLRIELGEIETALRAVPGVGQAVVVVRGDERLGDQLVGYLVPDHVADTPAVDVDTVRSELSRVLPAYMVPAAFVVLDTLPLTASGKLDRRALPAPVLEGTVFRAPATPVEQLIAEVYAEVLGVPRVGADDDFFALGGNSLTATRVVARVNDALAAGLSVRDLFEAADVAALAARIASGAGTSARRPALRRYPRPDRVPLSLAQQRMWVLNQLDTADVSYNIPLAIRLRGDLDVAAFQLAVRDVLARQEALRTRYPVADGVPFQQVLPVGELPSALDPVHTADPFGDLFALAMTSFDVTATAPLAVALLRAGPADHIFALVVNHIAADGVSLATLARDLVAAYTARRAGGSFDMPSLAVHYADYALWQREVIGDDAEPDSVAARQLAHWRATLAGLPELLDLPTDRPRPPRPSMRGAAVEFDIPAELHAGLVRLSRAHSATPFMVIHAALAVLLARLSGSDDIAVGTPIAGRGERALDDVVGMFVNTLVLRTTVSGRDAFGALLEQAREADLTAFANADIPFERVVDALVPHRRAAYNPLYQVGLAFENFDPITLELPGLVVEAVDTGAVTAKTDVQVTISPGYHADGSPADSRGMIVYATDLFDEDTVRTFARRLRHILAAVVADPGVAVGDIELLDESDAVRPVATRPEPIPGAGTALVQSFTATVEEDPEAPAVVQGEAELSYGELDRRSSRLARVLLAHGGGPGTAVRVPVADRDTDTVVALWAVLKAGAAVAGTAGPDVIDVTELLSDPAVREELAAASARPVTYADRPRPLQGVDLADTASGVDYDSLARMVDAAGAATDVTYESSLYRVGDSALAALLEAVLSGTIGAVIVSGSNGTLVPVDEEVTHVVAEANRLDSLSPVESVSLIVIPETPDGEGLDITELRQRWSGVAVLDPSH